MIFSCEDLGIDFPVFTTRPDTLFGATFFVMAPEHPDVERLAAGTEHEAAVPRVRERVSPRNRRGAWERRSARRPEVPLGRTITNPVNGEQIPMFVADYVLDGVRNRGDHRGARRRERDFDFARAFDLPIRRVIATPLPGTGETAAAAPEGATSSQDELPYLGDGEMVNSGRFDGRHNRKAYDEIIAWLESDGRGKPTVHYRLRDWLVSRQRYWGCPIPVVYCETDGIVPRPEDQLPVLLPEVDDYAPKGTEPAGCRHRLGRDRMPTLRRPGPSRETDTMDTFVDSSWYFLRYLDADNDHAAWDRAAADYWMPVDQYIGGVEHAILHPTYARFFIKALADTGHPWASRSRSPASSRRGMITRDGAKMSSSKGNVVSAAETVNRDGADTARTYVCFMGPPAGRRGLDRRERRGGAPVPDSPLAPEGGGRGAHLSRRIGDPRLRDRRGRLPATCSASPIGRSTRSPATSTATSASTPQSPR